MITAADLNYIRNIIFSLVNFTFSGQITTEYHDGIRVSFDGSSAAIGCKDKTTLARGLFLLALHAKDGAFSLEEKAAFDRFTVHIDVSRNRVLKVASVKKYMEYMAALGFNSLTLYMEDVFHMEKYPRFGYMRGRYEIAELQEIDNYADSLGIEVFPTVQTPGHMEQFLRWNEAKAVKDTNDCLLVGADETYELIEEIFKTMADFNAVLALTESREDPHFTYCKVFTTCVIKKCQILHRIRSAYSSGDREYLQTLCGKVIPELIEDYRVFHKMFRKDWLESSKPFGLETTDIRIAGAISRMETAIERIREYLDGKAPVIEELEEDYFVGNEKIIFASKIMTPSITL